MDDPNMHAYGEEGPDDAEIGRQWRENSSLEKWFPLTAERLAALEAENTALERSRATYFAERNSARDAWRDRVKRCEALEAALTLAVHAMRAPLDDWKGECERRALDAANAALGPNARLSGAGTASA